MSITNHVTNNVWNSLSFDVNFSPLSSSKTPIHGNDLSELMYSVSLSVQCRPCNYVWNACFCKGSCQCLINLSGSLWSCSGQAISILLNLANHTSLLSCPVCFLWNVPKNSTLNIEIMRTRNAKWLSICSWYCKFDNLYVQSGAVIIILSFSFVVFSERELKFMFAICRRPSVCRLSSVCLSVCLSVVCL